MKTEQQSSRRANHSAVVATICLEVAPIAQMRRSSRASKSLRLALLLGFSNMLLAQLGGITEYRIPTSGATAAIITSGPDGALWFTENAGNKIGRITTAGVITEYPVPTANSSLWGITAGPDGALWFTGFASNYIGRITTAGAISEYSVPTGNSGPDLITAGPDGALWFTERQGNKIGRITTAGAITEYPVPVGGSWPYWITAGPDGALWFTEIYGNNIGRITVAGVITEYAVPTGGSQPLGITTGPDGALWFNESSANKIGRITVAGVITEYPVPTANSALQAITTGPDGALWFTENAGNKIGRITAVGVITEQTVPTANSMPVAITTGPDGALWFTENNSDNIGRLAIQSEPPSIGGVVSASAFGEFSSVSPGSWIEIYGLNLAADTRSWTGADFSGINAPTSLDRTSVAIGGQAAFIDYISPGQVNALVPSNVTTGIQQITLTTAAGTSGAYDITVNTVEPGLLAPSSFNVNGIQYVVAQFADGSYVLPTGAIAGLTSRLANPGDTIVIYGVGFGPVTPSIPAGQLVQESNVLSSSFKISIGGTVCGVAYDGLAPNYTGLYQFNIVVPAIAAGDAVPLTFTVDGAAGIQTLYTAVGN